jgi:glycosyltransferase involved in cell wall biosynthesis
MELSKVKVSIIVPVYKVEKYLSRCLESLMNQTLKDIEIILVDDGSSDSSSSMCDEFAVQDSRIKVIHKQNGGLGFARNSGLEIATGEFVAFVDSDDYVHLQMYETLYYQAKNLYLDAIYCGFNNVDKKQNISRISEVDSLKIFDSQKEVHDFLLDMIGTEPNYPVDRKYQMSVWRAIYSKKIIDKHNIKFCSEREFISEDIIFQIDYVQKVTKMAFIPETMYFYCENQGSLSRSFRPDRFDKYIFLHSEIRKKLFSISDKKSCELRIDRLFIGYSRSLIFDICRYKVTIKEKKQLLKIIYENIVWNDIHSRYPYNELPFKYGFLMKCIKYRWTNMILLYSYIVHLKKIVN